MSTYTEPSSNGAPQPGGQPRLPAAWVAGGLAALLLAGGGALYWSRHDAPPRLSAPLPLPPPAKVVGKPAELQKRLADAEQAAAAPTRRVEDIAALGRLYHINGYMAEAEACWRLLVTVQPREPRWHYYLADIQRTRGDYEPVEAELLATLQLDPTYAPAWLRLAELQFKTGRLEEAERNYERRLALLPGDAYARLGLARVALQREQVSRGRELLEKLVQDAPGFAPSRNLYAEMLENAGETAAAKQQRIAAAGTTRFREADDPWIEALNDSCYDPKRLLVLGTIEYQTEHGDHGTGYLERAFALAPSDRETCQALAELYLKLKQPDKARIALERGLQTVKPPAVMLYVDLGEAYRALHRWDDAMRVVRDGQTVFPDAFQLHNETGAILGDQQRHEEAIAAYTRALALAPNDTDSNFSLGLELLKLGRNAEGKEYVKRALRLQPQFPGALAVLGKLELEAGNLEAAAGYLKPLYDSRPDSEYSRQLLAQWHLRAGDAAAAKNDHATALREYSAGFELDPRNAALATRAGTAWLVAGKPAEAIPPLEALYKLKPADPQSSLYLGGAYARIGRVDDARRLLQQGEELAQKAGNSETAAYCREMLSQLR